MTDSDEASVTPLVRRAAAWSWRLLVILAAAVVVLEVMRRFGLVVVPVALALMLTAMLLPAVDFLDRYGAARGGAVAFVVILGLSFVVAILGFVVSQFVDGLPSLVEQVTHSIDTLRNWLINGPIQLSHDQINLTGDAVIKSLNDHQAQLTSGALSTAGTVAEILTGALLTLFTLIFFLLGGRNIWEFVTRLVPEGNRDRVRTAGGAGFHSLAGYARATFLVALVDVDGLGDGPRSRSGRGRRSCCPRAKLVHGAPLAERDNRDHLRRGQATAKSQLTVEPRVGAGSPHGNKVHQSEEDVRGIQTSRT